MGDPYLGMEYLAFGAYLNKQSVIPGDILDVKIHCPNFEYNYLTLLQGQTNLLGDLTNYVPNPVNSGETIEINTVQGTSTLTCTLEQLYSTPGILYNQPINVTPGHYMLVQFMVSNATPGLNFFPCIGGYTGFFPYIVWLNLTLNIINLNDVWFNSFQNTYVLFQIPEGFTQIAVFMLVDNVQNLGDYFVLNYMYLYDLGVIDPNNYLAPPYQIVNLSLYDKYKNIVTSINNIKTYQQQYKPLSFAVGCDWQTTVQLAIPNIPSDIYIIELSGENYLYYVPLILRNNKNIKGDLLILINTNTWNAYNTWAGLDGSASLYTYNVSDNTYFINVAPPNDYPSASSQVSFQRPSDTNSQILYDYMNTTDYATTPYVTMNLYHELLFLQFLNSQNINYDIITDLDYNNYNYALDYKALVLTNHCEYWSLNQLNNLNYYLNQGGNFIDLGGNLIYWRCSIQNDIMEVAKNYIEGTTTYANNYQDNLPGGQWQFLQGLIYPNLVTQYLIGEYYNGNYTYNASQMNYPYNILQPTSFIFTGIPNTQTQIGFNNINTFPSQYAAGQNGASGWELDVDITGKFEQYVIAFGANPGNNGGYMIYFQNENNAMIFCVGSLTYCGSLFVDSGIQTITMNIFKIFLLPKFLTNGKTNEELSELLNNL